MKKSDFKVDDAVIIDYLRKDGAAVIREIDWGNPAYTGKVILHFLDNNFIDSGFGTRILNSCTNLGNINDYLKTHSAPIYDKNNPIEEDRVKKSDILIKIKDISNDKEHYGGKLDVTFWVDDWMLDASPEEEFPELNDIDGLDEMAEGNMEYNGSFSAEELKNKLSSLGFIVKTN
jgi:hypothetical protein